MGRSINRYSVQDTMRWTRYDKETGDPEALSENQIRQLLGNTYEPEGVEQALHVMEQGEVIHTPYAWYAQTY